MKQLVSLSLYCLSVLLFSPGSLRLSPGGGEKVRPTGKDHARREKEKKEVTTQKENEGERERVVHVATFAFDKLYRSHERKDPYREYSHFAEAQRKKERESKRKHSLMYW